MKIINQLRILLLLTIIALMAIPINSRHRKVKSKGLSHKASGKGGENVCYQPGFLRRAVDFVGNKALEVVKLFYDPEYTAKYKEAIKMITTENINQKDELFKRIVSEHPDLTDSQIIRINYYLGTKTFEEIQHSEIILQNVRNFIQKSSEVKNSDDEYIRTLQKILLTNQPELSEMILKMDYLDYSIYAEMQGRLHKYFMEKEFQLFESKKLFRFSQLSRKVHSIKNHSSKNGYKIPEFIKDKSQFALDSLKNNIDLINSKAKKALSTISKVKDTIKNTEILMNLSKALLELDNIPVLEKVNEKIKNKVQQIEGLPIVGKIKKASGRADILSMMIKVEQGKANEKDYVNLAQKLSREFGIKALDKPLNLAKSFLDIKENLEKFKKTEKASVKIGNILLALGNVASITPNPIAQTLSPVLKGFGSTITTYKSVQNIIDEEIEIFVQSTKENLEQGNLPFFSQFISDFAMDAFLYNDSDQERKHGLKEVIQEVKERYLESPYSEEIKTIVREMNDEREAANERGELDRYSIVGSDWDIGEKISVDNSALVDRIKEKYDEFMQYLSTNSSGSESSNDRRESSTSDSNNNSKVAETDKSEDTNTESTYHPSYDITATETEKCFERDIQNSVWGRKFLRKIRRLRRLRKLRRFK
jgi:hypothetical protein